MTEFSNDVRQVFSKGTTARTSLLDLVPKIERVDSYAGSKFKSQVEPLRMETDRARQEQRESATEMKAIIANWLMIHDSARDPDLLQDIIDECSNMLNTLSKNASKANGTPEKTTRLAEQVASLRTVLDSTIKEKDKAIDATLDETSKEVKDLDTQVTKIDTELTELRGKGNAGAIGRIVEAGKSALKSTSGSTPSTTGTGGDTEDPTTKEKIRKLEADRVVVQGKLDDARERKRQAVAVGDARTTAKGLDPVGGANKAHMDLLSWSTASGNLLSLWNALTREITTYQRLFQAKKDNPSINNQRTLADEIKRVTTWVVPKLKDLQRALEEGSHNL